MALINDPSNTASRNTHPHILTSPDGLKTVYTKPTADVNGIRVPMLWVSESDGSGAYPLNVPVRSIEDVSWTSSSNTIRVTNAEGKTRVIDVSMPSDSIADQIDQGGRDEPSSRVDSLISGIKQKAPLIAAGAVGTAVAVETAAQPEIPSASATNPNLPKQNWISRSINRLTNPSKVTPIQNKKEEVKDQAKAEAKQQIKKQVVKQGEKLAARIAARAATMLAAATSEIWLPILIGVIGVVVAIIAVVAMIGVGQSGILGSSFHEDSAKKTELTALANAGDVFARRELDAADIPKILVGIEKIRVKAQAKSDTEAITIIDKIKATLTGYSSSDSKVDQSALKEVQTQLVKLSAKGYGSTLSRFTTHAALAEISALIVSNRIKADKPNDRVGLTTGSIPRDASKPGTPDPVPLNPMIPLFLKAIDRDFGPVTISSIVGTHPRNSASNNQSAHWTGDGMDINYLKGLHVKEHKEVVKELLQWILDHKKELEEHGIKINQTIGPAQYASLQLRSNQQVEAGGGYKQGHEDHFHIGFYSIGSIK